MILYPLSPPLERVSGLVSSDQLETITAIGGDRGVSAGLRDVVGAGLLALQGDVALLAPIDQLQRLADQLALIQGRRTPTGAWWAPTNEALPSPEQLDPSGAVLVTPQAVCLIGDGCLLVDLQVGRILANRGGHETSIPIDLTELVNPAALLPPSMAGLAAAGAGRRELGLGLSVERLPSNAVMLGLQGCGPLCDPNHALAFSSELLGLICRETARSVATREQLNRQLQEASHG
jgi:hypothetical protein